jgi:hypothetical protein
VNVSCETCGKTTVYPVHLCGQCATDWQDGANGRRRINRRRRTNGLGELSTPALREQVVERPAAWIRTPK